MNDNLVKLLEELKNINTYANDCESPNIFIMLGIENKEVLMCRMLKAIIEPNGVHGLGVLPLKLFLEELGVTVNERLLQKAFVSLEEVIDENRRVDIAIHIDSEVIPIEAKVYAADQPKQLFDYFNYYKNRGYEINKIYYLTPNGKEPSRESVVTLPEDQIGKISFSTEVISFINKLLTKNISTDLASIILSFRGVLEKMSKENKMKDYVKQEVERIVDSDVELKKSVFTLLKYGDDIRKLLEKQYFNDSLKKSGFLGYTVEIDDGETEFSGIDKHGKYCIVKDNEIIAYLCVETNLYIAKRITNTELPEQWSFYPESDYAWAYIRNKQNKKWALKEIDLNLFEQHIDWNLYL